MEMNQSQMTFEVVFVSADKSQEDFNEYYAEMPWLAMPWRDSRIKNVAKPFKVQGIPRLIVLNAKTGAVISEQAVDIVKEQGPVILEEWLEKI